MVDYKYKILKFLIENGGKADIVTFINKETDRHPNANEIKNDIAVKIIEMSKKNDDGYINQLLMTQNMSLGIYFNKGMMIMDEEPIVISISDKGVDEYYRLDKLYNPPQPIPIIHYETHGSNSPIAGRDLSIGDMKTNEESPEMQQVAKKGLTINKWLLIVGIIAILLPIVLWLLKK